MREATTKLVMGWDARTPTEGEALAVPDPSERYQDDILLFAPPGGASSPALLAQVAAALNASGLCTEALVRPGGRIYIRRHAGGEDDFEAVIRRTIEEHPMAPPRHTPSS